MKLITRNNYVDVSSVPAVLFGIGYSHKIITVFIGPILFEIKTYNMFRRSKSKSISGIEI